MTLKLEEEYWNTGSEGQYISIRIELRSFTKKTVKSCVEETLKNQYKLSEEEIEQIKKNKKIRLIVLFDGYDEIGDRPEFNLYDESGLRDWDCEIKVIITCRSQHFTSQSEFERCFVLNDKVMNTKLQDGLKLIYVAPFSEDQMKQYLIQYSEEYQKKKEGNQFPLENIQELLKTQSEFKSLLSNPFVLKIFSEVAPKISSAADLSKTEKVLKLNRAEIYQAFLEDWFLRAKVKLESSVNQSSVSKKPKDIERYFFQYARQLAFLYYKTGITELKYEEAEPEWSEFQERELIQEGNAAFKEFFGSDQLEVVEARKACPLRRSGESAYSFVHKSFQDYLVARHLYLVLKSGNEKLTIENWNTRYLSEDRAVLRFIAELIDNDAERKKLEERLLQIVKSSSEREDIDMASSNAISVLNWNYYSFSGMDLQRIRVPKSYLERVNFSGVDLSKSNLRGSFVSNSEWSEANLEGSDLRELEFGEYPAWEQGSIVSSLVFNRAGTQVAAGDENGNLRIWSYPEGKLMKKYRVQGHELTSVALSPDGKRLAIVGKSSMIQIMDLKSGIKERVLMGDSDAMDIVSWSADGKWLVSGGFNRVIRLWDVEKKLEERRFEGHKGGVNSFSWSMDGKWLASGSGDNTVRIWDVEKGVEKRVLKGHTGSVTTVSWSEDGKRVASAGWDTTIRVWDVENGVEERVLRGHAWVILSVSWSVDSKRLASGSEDESIRIWNVESGVEERVLKGHTGTVMAVSWSKDGKRIVSGASDKTIRIWGVESSVERRELPGHTNDVVDVSWSFDGKWIASGSCDQTIRLWGVNGSRVGQRVLLGHTDWVTNVRWSVDGKRLASSSDDGTVRLWDVGNGLEEYLLKDHKKEVIDLCWSKDGKRLASVSVDGAVRLLDVGSGLEEYLLKGHKKAVLAVDWSEDGRRLASGSEDKTIRIWDVGSGLEEYLLKGHKKAVLTVDWSEDGRRLASGSEDKTIRIWDAISGVHKRTLKGHTWDVTSVSWSMGNKLLASGSRDRTIRLWDVEDDKCAEVVVFNQIVSSVSFHESNDRTQEYLAAGIGHGVYVFSVVKSELDALPRLILKWRTEYYLWAQNANLENALIEDMNRRLLEQRGAKKSKDIVSNSTTAAINQGFFSSDAPASSSTVSIAQTARSSAVGSTNLNAGLDEDAALALALQQSLSVGTDAESDEDAELQAATALSLSSHSEE